ncbi:MAG: hypothetical protein N3H84_08370, partial [Candidatus Caldarchaeum sp.]|nr:hypothetical protein [Candidatus Caldarchaeum sp.]
GLVLAVLSFVTFVLEIVSHFRAATVLNSRWFRRAAWMRITLVIVLIVIVVALIGLAFLLPLPGGFGPVEQLTGGLILLFLPVIVLGLLASVFSAVAFFTAEYP